MTLALALLYGFYKDVDLHLISSGMPAEREGEPITRAQMEEVAYPFGCHVATLVNLKNQRKHVELPPKPPSDDEDEDEDKDGDEEDDEATDKAAAQAPCIYLPVSAKTLGRIVSILSKYCNIYDEQITQR